MQRRQRHHRQDINRQAWDDIAPVVREMFARRQQELLDGLDSEDKPKHHPVNWPARRISGERTNAFRLFVIGLLRDGTLDNADEETLDLVEVFIKKPLGGNRLKLYAHLRRHPELLKERYEGLTLYA